MCMLEQVALWEDAEVNVLLDALLEELKEVCVCVCVCVCMRHLCVCVCVTCLWRGGRPCVDKAQLLNLCAIDAERVVVEELLVEVWTQRRVLDARHTAHVGPGLQVLLVALLRHPRHVQLGKVGHDAPEEPRLNPKQHRKHVVDRPLRCMWEGEVRGGGEKGEV
jgi:hypothetical protein